MQSSCTPENLCSLQTIYIFSHLKPCPLRAVKLKDAGVKTWNKINRKVGVLPLNQIDLALCSVGWIIADLITLVSGAARGEGKSLSWERDARADWREVKWDPIYLKSIHRRQVFLNENSHCEKIKKWDSGNPALPWNCICTGEGKMLLE